MTLCNFWLINKIFDIILLVGKDSGLDVLCSLEGPRVEGERIRGGWVCAAVEPEASQ